jgi:hypothetical protein
MNWTPEQVDTLRRLHAAGCNDEEIALALSITPRAATGKRQRLGLLSGRRTDAYETAIARASRARAKETTT